MSKVNGESPVSGLAGNIGVNSFAEQLAKASAERATQDNTHRNQLFKFIIIVVIGALVSVIALIVVLLFLPNRLEPTVVIAFISALAIQSFILVGFLARGLFPVTSTKNVTPENVE